MRLLIEKYDINVNNVVNVWNGRINKNKELVRRVKEVVGMRTGFSLDFGMI